MGVPVFFSSSSSSISPVTPLWLSPLWLTLLSLLSLKIFDNRFAGEWWVCFSPPLLSLSFTPVGHVGGLSLFSLLSFSVQSQVGGFGLGVLDVTGLG